MARKPRLHAPGALYHVMLRGNGGGDIFFKEEDRYHLCLLLQEGVARFGHRIHAYCLMGNHLHLALQVGEIPLSKIMQNVSFRYTRWINKRQRRMGHLFQGRYKALLVDADRYLLELVRYIHLNPVRAKLVEKAADYPWSGHRAFCGVEETPWLTTDWVLGHFAESEGLARQRYAAFVADAQGEGYRAEFHQGGNDARMLGDDRFVEALTGTAREDAAPPLTLRELARAYCVLFSIEEADLRGPARTRDISEVRGMFAWLATKHGIATLMELGSYLNRDATTLSRAVRRVETRQTKDGNLMRRLSEINNALMQA